MNTRSLGIALVFVAGCAVGGVSGQFVVPRASAQQAALAKWDYMCFEENRAEDVEPKAKAAGAEGWELVAVQSQGLQSSWCFKRKL